MGSHNQIPTSSSGKVAHDSRLYVNPWLHRSNRINLARQDRRGESLFDSKTRAIHAWRSRIQNFSLQPSTSKIPVLYEDLRKLKFSSLCG